MQFLSADQLHQAMTEDKDLLVIAVCDTDGFESDHIAGTINIPLCEDGFVRRVREKTGDPHRPLVLYDLAMNSGLAQIAAGSLEGAGFSQTRVYVSGVAHWRESGFKVGQGPVQR